MFKIENSKFYTEIMESVVKYFNMDAGNVTEAEVHQKIVEAETVEAMTARLTADANAAVKTQMETLQTQLNDLSAKVTALETEAGTNKTALEAANLKVTELETEAASNKTALESANAKVTELGGQVATLKAGKPVGGTDPQDANLNTGSANALGGTTIQSTELGKKLGTVK